MFLFNISTEFFVPLIIILAISVITPIILSILKLKFLPSFVIELIVGIAIAGPFNQFMDKLALTSFIDGLYVISLSVIMFLSGYDVDLKLMKFKTVEGDFCYLKKSILLLSLVYLVSFGLSWFFVDGFTAENIVKVLLITLALSGIFAGLVVPLLHSEHAGESRIGKFIQTFANLAELTSIVLLSIFMIVVDISEGEWYFGVIMVAIIVIAYIISHKFNISFSERIKSGIVHLPMRLLFLSLFVFVFLSDLSGGEYILGSFLFGILCKTLKIHKQAIHAVEEMVYGVFAPMLYIIVGTKIDIGTFFAEPQLFLTVLALVVAIVVARLPLLLLLKNFKFKDVASTIVITSCTIIVSIAVEHIGGHHGIDVLPYNFTEALILASVITCIIPPVLFEAFLDFGVTKKNKANEENLKNEENN